MAVNPNDKILAAEYNSLRNRTASLLGAGVSDFGYGQPVSASEISSGAVMTAARIGQLRDDMSRVYLHQTGNTFPLSAINSGDIVGADQSGTSLTFDNQGAYTFDNPDVTKGYNDYLSLMNTLETNRFDIAPSQQEIDTARVSDARTLAWSGSGDVVVSGFDLSNVSYDNVSFSVASEDGFPSGLAFNNDGTKMYMVGPVSDSVHQYSLSTAFDLSTAGYDSVSFSVASEDGLPSGLAFNNDGTKMYMVGPVSGSVHQYTLSTAFDLSTAGYDGVSFSVASEEGSPLGLVFNNDGTKMHVLGNATNSVHQYSLSTAFDVSTASYDNVSFSVASEDTSPTGVAFNNDGTKMYVIGNASDSVYQYSLSTAFDLSTASYDNVSFSVASEDTSPLGIAFNNTGTKMYVVGISSDSVHQYSLSTAVDLTPDRYDNVSFSVASEDTSPLGIAFNNTGTKMYVIGNASDSVYQYSLSTAFDLSTAGYDSVSFSVASEEGSPLGIAFNNDGTKMYMVGPFSDSVHQYTLSTAFDLSTAGYDGVSFSVASEEGSPLGLVFNNTGTKMYVVGFSSRSVHQYSLSSAFDLSTAGYDSVSLSVASKDTNPYDIAFNNDGTKMYVVGLNSDNVYQYSLSTAFDLSTASYDNVSFSVASEDTSPTGVAFNNDGTKMYVIGNFSDSVHQYSLSTAFDLTPDRYDSVNFNVSAQDSTPFALAFSNDGTKMYIMGIGTDSVYQYSLSTAFDVSTASYDSVSLNVNAQEATPIGLAFNNDGTKMYVVGVSSRSVHQYSLSSAFDLSTAGYDSVSLSVSAQDPSPREITFNNDGTKMYVIGLNAVDIYQYSLSTAFDLSTAGYDSVSLSVLSEDAVPEGLAFNNDGSKMYVVGTENDSVHRYSLSTAFDLSTASYDNVSFSVASEETEPRDIVFNNDGTKMYVVGTGSNSVYQYSLAVPFDITTASLATTTATTTTVEGPPSVSSTISVSFASPAARRHFFNAGGEIRISSDVTQLDSGSQSHERNLGWQSMLDDPGAILVGHNYVTMSNISATNVQFLQGTSFGNSQLTSTYREIFRKTAATGTVYENSYWAIEARVFDSTTLNFRIILQDDGATGNNARYPVTASISTNYGGRRPLGSPQEQSVTLPYPVYTVINSFE